MGCSGCAKRRKASGVTYLECPVCGTVLHNGKGSNPKINGTAVCGQCYKKYKAIKELEKTKPKKEIKKNENT